MTTPAGRPTPAPSPVAILASLVRMEREQQTAQRRLRLLEERRRERLGLRAAIYSTETPDAPR